MKDFNFDTESPEEKSLIRVAKEIEENMADLVTSEPEKSKDEFAEIAAKVLFDRFGGERFDLAAE